MEGISVRSVKSAVVVEGSRVVSVESVLVERRVEYLRIEELDNYEYGGH